MRLYRFYSINKSGHIDGPAIDHDLPDDRAAIATASQIANGRDIEIWLEERLVAYVTAQEKAARA